MTGRAEWLAAAFALAAVLAAGSASAGSPRILYALHCQGCHLADGSGRAGEVPSLVGTLGRLASAPGGRAFLVQVPGSAQSPLTDAELASVLNWMVASFATAEDAAGFRPYDAVEVGRHRETPLVDVVATRAALLRRMGADD